MGKKLVFVVLIWLVVAVVVFILYIYREITPVKEIITWALSVWPILAALGGIGILISGWVIRHNFSKEAKPISDGKVNQEQGIVTLINAKNKSKVIVDDFTVKSDVPIQLVDAEESEVNMHGVAVGSQTANETKALDWVTCDKCGFIGARNIKTRELEEMEDNQRRTGQPILTRINSLGDTEPRHEKIPECIMQAEDFATLPPLSSQPLPLFYMQLPRQCQHFIKWQKGSSPKEHKEIIDRQLRQQSTAHKEGSQSLGDGIQPKSYDKRDVIISNEPEISIKIDNCSWGNPKRIGNEPMRIIEVALTLNVQNPPVNVTALQLYIEDGLQKFVDSSPSIPFTQENTKGCYIARFGFSYSSPNFVISNEVKKYQLRVMAMGQKWTSKDFSPKDFSHLLAPDKEGSQT